MELVCCIRDQPRRAHQVQGKRHQNPDQAGAYRTGSKPSSATPPRCTRLASFGSGRGSVWSLLLWNGRSGRGPKARLYPNLYVVLVATPGIGKSVVLSRAFKILHKVQDLQIAPESVTAASLIDAVAA